MPAPQREDYDTIIGALEKRITRLERSLSSDMDLGVWARVGTGGVTFGAKFTDHSYLAWWRHSGDGMVHLRGLAQATTAIIASDVILQFPVGLRMSASFGVEQPFAVGMNPSGGTEIAGMVMFETVAGTLVTRQTGVTGGWWGLDSISFLAEA